jgi:hypothetical protein
MKFSWINTALASSQEYKTGYYFFAPNASQPAWSADNNLSKQC